MIFSSVVLRLFKLKSRSFTSEMEYFRLSFATLDSDFSENIRDVQWSCIQIIVKCLCFQGPVPERPISINPVLKFCSVFVFYIPMHCLG